MDNNVLYSHNSFLFLSFVFFRIRVKKTNKQALGVYKEHKLFRNVRFNQVIVLDLNKFSALGGSAYLYKQSLWYLLIPKQDLLFWGTLKCIYPSRQINILYKLLVKFSMTFH